MQKDYLSNWTSDLIWFIFSILQMSCSLNFYACVRLVDLMVILNVQNVLLEISFANLVDLCSTLITLFTTQSARFISKNALPLLEMGLLVTLLALGYIATTDGPKQLKMAHLTQYQLGTVLVWRI